MNDPSEPATRHTVLHDWHEANGARMVPFAGWEMPVQYTGGIIAEHLATRRGAGLFDVSHMGRFHVGGDDAVAFLSSVLTNNPRALGPGEAQYTFIANETGGAVDDAYLYRVDADDWLLVVNASNRDAVLACLTAAEGSYRVTLEDRSDALGMVSLQGPTAEHILEQVVPRAGLPENKRNRIATVASAFGPLVVARTGYTGESVCFELFPRREHTVALWERLVELGATAVGLGARDSLRLEAGLPLYGHELGLDPDGNEIPIFANGLARFAVRSDGGEPYGGQAALERQRAAVTRILRHEPPAPGDAEVLPRLVQPIAVFDGRRPLRAGYEVHADGRKVGYVTSGTTVPYSRFRGRGITARPDSDHELRPIGLALLDTALRYRSDRPVAVTVLDNRGKSFQAELVERNLWPVAPYSRAYGGFEALRPGPAAAGGDYNARARALRAASDANTRWRRTECINLIPSEQCTSAFVDALCVSDPSGRYNEHNRLKALGPNADEVRYYKGTDFAMEKEEELKAALRAFFDCSQAEVRVVSGQMANDTVYDALKQFRNRHRRGQAPRLLGPVLVHDLNKGGHLSAQVAGALKNYVAIDPDTERAAVEHFPFMAANPHRIDTEATRALIAERRPDLIVFGRSVIIEREPVAEISRFVHETFGADNPERPLIMYDGAHVLGLLGPYFQAPLAEGADIVTGSTHKTFFGPQRGVILSNIGPGSPFESLWRHIETRAFPGHVSNHHLGTMIGLLGATYEMLAFKDTYPRLVIENARAFAQALHAQGLTVEGEAAHGFTATHQVLLRGPRAHGEEMAARLEHNGIITNPQAFHDDPSFAAASGVRMGTPEMTRHGMGAADFAGLAELIAEIVREGGARPAGHWRERVKALRAGFVDMRYCLG